MRYYKVNKMKHAVYDTIEEVPSNIKPLKDWRKANIGDWVIADDDCIIQILRKGNMLRHNGERGYVGTCTGTFINLKSTIMDTDKRTNIYSFGGNRTPEEIVVNRKSMTANEELFVTYISQGLSPEDAYVKAFPTNNKRYARMKAVNLIKTERIKTAVKEELKPILQELDIDERMVLENIKIVAQTAEKDDTKLKALFKLSDILDLEDKGSAKVQQVTGIAFQGLTNDMIDAAERPKEIKSE
ncbi:MAG: hypothetical protein Unbinned3338contig1000_27 [Prokaryotic dsDNA virus sp.]|nr:MAG: hypothetical protein Unbinned3338contig1000_27 [Prokaryotic dsDNA virus sp.]